MIDKRKQRIFIT